MSEIYQWIGILTIFFSAIYLMKKLFRGIWTSFLGNALGFSYNIKPGQDAYAIITGATDGIGLEYAKYFAKKGFNLLLISRSSDKLNETKDLIVEKFSNCKEVRVHQADFSRSDIYDGIKKAVEELPKVEVLVNNVGISYKYPEYLTKLPDDSWKLIDDLINVNILSVTRMHQIVLPLMEVNQKGLILNLSSFSATYPTPLLAVYGATKTYVDFLSRALQIEYQRKKIVIQSVLPAFVQTKMSKVKKPSLMIPKPEDYIKAQMKTVGLEYRTYGYIPHKIQGFVLDSISNNLFGPYLNSIIVYSNLKKLRKIVYRKFNLKDN